MVRLVTALALATVFGLSGPASHAGTNPAEPATFEDEAQATLYRVVVPNLASDGEPATASISASSAYQGGAVHVSVSNAVEGEVRLFGRSYPLLPAGNHIEGFVGVGVLDPPGSTALEIGYTDRLGVEHAETVPFAVLETEWTVDYIWLPPGGDDYLDPVKIQEEAELLAAIYGGPWTAPAWDGAWTAPIAGLSQEHISGYFGEQRSFNGGPVGGHHGGTDIAVAAGTPVLAANAGRVVLARELFVRGNMVIIDHGGGVFSGYAHLESIAVSEGLSVAKGQVLGAVGSTGLSTGPHLHWEMAVAGILVDGLRWLDRTQGF